MDTIWVERLALTNFRNHESVALNLGEGPVVLYGPNGAGKTNLLEAVSLLSPGRGLRRTAFSDLPGHGHGPDWAVSARVHAEGDIADIGTGLQAQLAPTGSSAGSFSQSSRPERSGRAERSGRIVRINGTQKSGSGSLGFVHMLWLTPASDGLFVGPAADRRRFLDRFTSFFDSGHGPRAGQFDRAMRQRNRLLDDGVRDAARFDGLEMIMAETGVAMAAARGEVVTALSAEMMGRRQRDPNSLFPWAGLKLEGTLEEALATKPAVDAEDEYRENLARNRERDRGYGRTLDGPHRTDLLVSHGPKAMPAKLCSTGEQKALLVGLVLAHAEHLALRRGGAAPIMLLDEIAAHLDVDRRNALYQDLVRLRTQAWLTGTDRMAFEGLESEATFHFVENGIITQV